MEEMGKFEEYLRSLTLYLNFYQMNIKITIQANSKAAEFIKKYIAEKKAFKEAVANCRNFNDYVECCKHNNIKFDAVIDPSLL